MLFQCIILVISLGFIFSTLKETLFKKIRRKVFVFVFVFDSFCFKTCLKSACPFSRKARFSMYFSKTSRFSEERQASLIVFLCADNVPILYHVTHSSVVCSGV